jgi:hypothetical protein
MQGLTTDVLARACHAFMSLAYPGGPDTIPEERKTYYDLPRDRPVEDFLRDLPEAKRLCQSLTAEGGGCRGYALRLGSAHFPHLKLKLQLIDYDHSTIWVFMVDTHDKALSVSSDHPDFQGIQALKAANLKLKERIEKALEREGLMTFPGLLRNDLEKSS